MTNLTRRDYDRWTEDQWKGKKVRSLRKVANGWAEMPAGTVFTVDGKFKGLSLASEPCSCCGIRMRVNRVDVHSLELADPT